MSGKRHLWDPGESLLRLAGRGAAQRVGPAINARGFLPRFGPQTMRKTLVLLVSVYVVFFSPWTSYYVCLVQEVRILPQYALALLLYVKGVAKVAHRRWKVSKVYKFIT